MIAAALRRDAVFRRVRHNVFSAPLHLKARLDSRHWLIHVLLPTSLIAYPGFASYLKK